MGSCEQLFRTVGSRAEHSFRYPKADFTWKLILLIAMSYWLLMIDLIAQWKDMFYGSWPSCAELWEAVGSCAELCTAVGSCAKLREAARSCAELCEAVRSCGKVWEAARSYGKLCGAVRSSAKLWEAVRRCAAPW